jgi:hypothetical protein
MVMLSLSVALSAVTHAQKTGAPKLVVEKADHDFGTVVEGKVVAHTFKLRNEGSADLVIKNVSPACGCTASEHIGGRKINQTRIKLQIVELQSVNSREF